MKHHLILILSIVAGGLLPIWCRAQSIDRQVVGIAGGWSQTSAGTLEWTVGETAVASRTAAATHWGEGFQQVFLTGSVATHEPESVVAMTVYPNPTTDFLNVEADAPIRVQLIDLNGRAMSGLTDVSGPTRIDMTMLPAGMYFLCAFDEQGRRTGVAKVQHVR